ncbi:MAG: hypothetical protein WCA12_17970 [Burkholderiales bacterium]
MKSTTAVAVTIAVAALASGVVGAQELLTGKYTGNYQRRSNQGLQATGLVVVIDSVEGGTVKGSATISGSQCAGNYPIEGKLGEGKLQIRTTEQGGRAGDCGLRLNLVVEGNKLKGTTGAGHAAELSR